MRLRMWLRLAAAAAAGIAPGQPGSAQDTPDSVVVPDLRFEMTVLTSGLAGPWEVTIGPDGQLWVSERVGKRIVRIDPADGSVTPAIEIAEVAAPGGQDGLLGLALHPELLQGTGNDYVYAAYTYEDRSRPQDPTVRDPFSPYAHLFTKIVRLTYDAARATLGDPVELIAGMPASNDHNSGRLKIGPDRKLYYTIGDGGNDQLGNWCIPILAQRLPTAEEIAAGDWWAYQGKSLRLELDGSIPEDNPAVGGVRSHIFTYGHRNMQGIDFGPDGTLYASEQGPKTDDEINILVPGGNYGWPHVAGFRDDMAYQYARWHDSVDPPCAALQFSDLEIAPSVPRADESAFTAEIVEPIATLFTVPDDWDFTDPICEGIDFICWPTVAASSIEVYDSEAIPGWQRSLIVTTLKRGSLYRLPLAADGLSVSGPIERYFQSENRFRDTAVSADGRTIYVATDPGGLAEQVGGGVTTTMQNPGAILVFTYAGEEGTGVAPDAAAAVPTADPADGAAADAGGRLLPSFTAAQAERGRAAYLANCVTCHGQNLVSATYGTPLAGPYFARKWVGRTVAALYAQAHDEMPPSRPASLPAARYADIVAYILAVNGVPAGDAELPVDLAALAAMTIPAAD